MCIFIKHVKGPTRAWKTDMGPCQDPEKQLTGSILTKNVEALLWVEGESEREMGAWV